MRLVVATFLLLTGRMALADGTTASPLLPPDHWAVKAADRLEELGLLDHYMPAQRAVPLVDVAAAFVEGERHAQESHPELVRIIRTWRERLGREWSGAFTQPRSEARLLGARLGAGYQGGVADEVNLGPSATGPSALHLEAPPSDPFAEGAGAVAYGSHLAASAEVHSTPWDVNLTGVELVGALGSVELSVGRGPIGYGPNEVGGVTMSGIAIMDRAEFRTNTPFRLPGFLGVLGDFTVDLALAHFNEPRHPYHPFLLDAQVQWRPESRLTFAVIHGFMFGGALWNGISFGHAALALTAMSNYSGNNVDSASVRYRLPTEAFLPLTAKVELGTDDNPGAAITWPGLVAGVTAPMLPVLSAAFGFEFAFFGHFITIGSGHIPFAWYAHSQYTGGWATGETPLGDPLGGEGRAFRLIASADPVPEIHLSAIAWAQDRFAHNNYAPMAAGQSVGLSGDADLRLGCWGLDLKGLYERGAEGWKRSAVEVGASVFF